MKIGQHLPILWAIKYRVIFMKHGVYYNFCKIRQLTAFHYSQITSYYHEPRLGSLQ